MVRLEVGVHGIELLRHFAEVSREEHIRLCSQEVFTQTISHYCSYIYIIVYIDAWDDWSEKGPETDGDSADGGGAAA